MKEEETKKEKREIKGGREKNLSDPTKPHSLSAL